MSKITAPNALAASNLAALLDAEGHTAVWFLASGIATVLTTAPASQVLAATSFWSVR